jgi:hypothetical protein
MNFPMETESVIIDHPSQFLLQTISISAYVEIISRDLKFEYQHR